MAYGKLIGTKMYEAPNILNKDGKQYINPSDKMYLEYGYLPLEYSVIPDLKPGYHLVQSWIAMGNRLVQKWNYEPDEMIDDINLQEKVKQLESIIDSLRNPYSNADQTFPEGDYMNPIPLMVGGLITQKNKWYYVNDKNRPHRAIIEGFVKPENFDDISWFYFV